MAFYTKYNSEFTDDKGIDWEVRIQVNAGGAFTIIPLVCTGDPLHFEWFGDDNLYDQRIMGSKMSLNIWNPTDFLLSELYTSDSLEYKVLVYCDSNLFWSGFILAESYIEPYNKVPIYTTIIAADGLGLLKNYKFEDFNYNSRQKAAKIIYDILSLVSITTFTEYINVYNDDMSDTVDDSPLDQMGIDPELFETANCYDALNIILRLFNAGIRQDFGIFTIYRFLELKDATMYGRVFTSATSKSSTTKKAAQQINRPLESSVFADLEGGELTMLAQAKQLINNYDLGYKESVLKHWDFQYDDFVYELVTATKWDIPNWDRANNSIYPISLYLPGENEGVYLYSNSNSIQDEYIEQSVAGLKARSPAFRLSFTYRVNNKYSTAPITYYLYYKITIVGSSTKYWTGASWELTDPGTPTSTRTTLLTAPEYGWADWQTEDIDIDGIPFDGTLTIRLYAAGNVNELLNVAYKDVKLLMTPVEGAGKTGIGYTADCGSTGRIIEEDLTLGDGFTNPRYAVNQLFNYFGVINTYNGAAIIDPALSWHTRGNTENIPINQLICTELGTQYSLSRQLIDIPILENDANTYLMSIGNLQDNLNTGKVFAINIYDYNVRERLYQLSLMELL